MKITKRRFSPLLALAAAAVLGTSSASATTILGSLTVYGNVPSVEAPNASSTSASQFNAAAANAIIQSNCQTGYTCSSLTLYQIDFTLTANVAASVEITNTTGSQQWIPGIGSKTVNGQAQTDSRAGTFAGGGASGIAIQQTTNVTIVDPLSNQVVTAIPTFSVNTTDRRVRNPTCTTGTANSNNFMNCLAVGTGNTTLSGNGSDTQTGSYNDVDNADIWAAILSTYQGAGSVSFGLLTQGGTDTGTLPSGVNVPSNTAQIQALADGLAITYYYSYEETQNPDPPGVPEPTAMALGGSALLALGMLRRKMGK